MINFQLTQEAISQFCQNTIISFNNGFPDHVFHYTSRAGMRGILGSGRIRASNINRLNDSAEVRYATSIMRAYVDRFYATEETEIAVDLLNEIRSQISNAHFENIFVLSFCDSGDQDGMWRLYAERGNGYSFAIPTEELRKWGGFVVRCQYDQAVLEKFCRDSINLIRSYYISNVTAGAVADPRPYASLFLYHVSWFAPIFKPGIWRDERELRVIFRKENNFQVLTAGGHSYIELPTSDPFADHLPITAIWAGPNTDYVTEMQPIQRNLNTTPYSFVPIFVSAHHKPKEGKILPRMGNNRMLAPLGVPQYLTLG